MQQLDRFLYVVQGKQKSLLGMIALFLLVSLLEMLGIGLVGPFISIATSPGSVQQHAWLKSISERLNLENEGQFLLGLGLLVIVIFYIKSYVTFTAQRKIFEFGFRTQGEISSRLMRAYLAAPYTFHLNRNSASLIQIILNETERFSNGLMMPVLTCISNFIVILALIALLIRTDAIATLTVAGILLICFFLLQRFKDQIARWGKEGSDARTEMIRLISHGIGGLKETRVIGCEAYFDQQMQMQAEKYATCSSSALSFSNLPRYAVEAVLITFLVGFTVLFLAFNQDNPQSLSAVLGVFALASIRLLPAVGNLLSSINSIRYSAYSLDKLYFDLKELEAVEQSRAQPLGYKPADARISPPARSLIFNREIVLDRVTYCYPGSPRNALESASLSIQKGQSIALIGKSGAGKTTLVDVILGLLIPQDGDIRVDGVSIYQNLRSWQNLVGYVPQSIFLIDDTLERNIAFGVPDEFIDSGRVERAVQAAQLSELIAQLPNGLQTEVGERGVALSGGQRQRVGIARALYHERDILVFDEATAALDTDTERLVTEAIKSLSGAKTIIIIAHRLSTVEHCDRIYLLERGQVVQAGSYEEVVLSK